MAVETKNSGRENIIVNTDVEAKIKLKEEQLRNMRSSENIHHEAISAKDKQITKLLTEKEKYIEHINVCYTIKQSLGNKVMKLEGRSLS